jgi:hypothetical protein
MMATSSEIKLRATNTSLTGRRDGATNSGAVAVRVT